MISTIKKLDIKLGENGNMKANRKFIEGEEAVSAVIGVILMVAITVAIAATVYVYVSGMLGSPGESAPTIQFKVDETLDRLEVVTADPDADWNDLQIKANKGVAAAAGAVYFRLNGEITAAVDGTQLLADAATEITATADTISASEYLDLEGYDSATPAAVQVDTVTLTIIHTGTNSIIGTYTFSTIHALDA